MARDQAFIVPRRTSGMLACACVRADAGLQRGAQLCRPALDRSSGRWGAVQVAIERHGELFRAPLDAQLGRP